MGKLTELTIRKAKPTTKDYWLGDGQGLYLRVRKAGAKTWIIRRKRHGKTQIITLGHYPNTPLKEARLKAAQYQLKKDVSNVSVKELVAKYMCEVVDLNHRRPELAQGYMDRAVIPILGDRKVRDVSRAELVDLIQDYSTRGARTADQLRSNLKALFSYSVELGYRDDNPLSEVSRRITGYTQNHRERVLTGDEVQMLWEWDDENARVLRFLILTGLRIGEAQKGFQEGGKWCVPSNISKNKKPHWAYLSPLALEQLPLPQTSATNIQAWLRRRLDNLKVTPRFTPHDLRRSAATIMATHGVEPFIVERCLGHTLQGIMKVYNKAEYEQERINASLVLEGAIKKMIS